MKYYPEKPYQIVMIKKIIRASLMDLPNDPVV